MPVSSALGDIKLSISQAEISRLDSFKNLMAIFSDLSSLMQQADLNQGQVFDDERQQAIKCQSCYVHRASEPQCPETLHCLELLECLRTAPPSKERSQLQGHASCQDARSLQYFAAGALELTAPNQNTASQIRSERDQKVLHEFSPNQVSADFELAFDRFILGLLIPHAGNWIPFFSRCYSNFMLIFLMLPRRCFAFDQGSVQNQKPDRTNVATFARPLHNTCSRT